MRTFYISPVPPWPTNRGGNQRTALLYRALAEIGQVDLLLVRDPKFISTDDLTTMREKFGLINCIKPLSRAERGYWRIIRPINPVIVDRLAHNFGSHSVYYQPESGIADWVKSQLTTVSYDLIVSRYLMPSALAGVLNMHPIIIDVDDLETQKYESRLKVPGIKWWERMMINSHLKRFEKIIPNCLANADHLWFTNNDDLKLINHQSKSILPNIPYVVNESISSKFSENNSSFIILAVCSMNFQVNENAIDHFVEFIWPLIHNKIPKAIFRVVGSKMTEEQKSRWSKVPGVDPYGEVQDLADEYKKCAITVIPIFDGGGTKIKVIESLSFGRSAVITPHALRGYEDVLYHMQSLIVADTDESFANACVYLLNSPNEREKLALEGKKLAEKHYNFEMFKSRVVDTIDNLILHKSSQKRLIS